MADRPEAMIAAILEALFGSLIKYAASWLVQREADRAAQKQAEAVSKAEASLSVDRDTTADLVEADRETTNAQLAQAGRDASGPNGVQRASEDAEAAIAAANRAVR